MAVDPIRVLLVEDSPVVLCVLQRVLEKSPDILVVGTARNGIEALEKIPEIHPQVICTDLWMDTMDGMELIQQTMAHFPCPILVISQAVDNEDTILQLKEMGALDVFQKPASIETSLVPCDRLIEKIKIIAGVRVFTRPLKRTSPMARSALNTAAKAAFSTMAFNTTQSNATMLTNRRQDIDVVAIGVSTGGPSTMQSILGALPRRFPIPILCTQHISQGFLEAHVGWLNARTRLRVSVAQEGEIPQAGHVYYAPDNCHLGITSHGRFWYDDAAPLDNHRPSVTKMFESVATFYGDRALGLLLTGMGKDGAAGLLSIAQAGGVTAAQDEASSVVFGMPKEAIALGAAQHIVGLDAIPSFLEDWVRVGRMS